MNLCRPIFADRLSRPNNSCEVRNMLLTIAKRDIKAGFYAIVKSIFLKSHVLLRRDKKREIVLFGSKKFDDHVINIISISHFMENSIPKKLRNFSKMT